MSFQEIFIILLVALLAFGPKKIPMLIRHLTLLMKFAQKIKLDFLQYINTIEKYEILRQNQQKALDAQQINNTVLEKSSETGDITHKNSNANKEMDRDNLNVAN